MAIHELYGVGPTGASGTEVPRTSGIEAHRRLISAVKSLNSSQLFGEDSEVLFSLDKSTHLPVVKIVNKDTKEVIRQLPPEYVLRIAPDVGH